MSLSTPRVRRAAAVAAVGAVALFSQPASAAPVDPVVIADGLFTPLSAAIADGETAYVSQNFAGTLMKITPEAEPEVVYASETEQEIGALSLDGDDVYFVEGAVLKVRQTDGESTEVNTVADLGAYEEEFNPDGEKGYGFRRISDKCADAWPTKRLGPPKYSGIVEAHPYASAVGDGSVYVADAAGNTILEVTDAGVETVAVMPSVKVAITRKIAKQNRLPDCVIGKIFRYEGVPTDVEVGPGGDLYVSSLPGGPEGGTPLGSVWRIDPATGDREKLASGLVSATGVAVDENANVYVSELFAGRITFIPAEGGAPSVFAEAVLPAALEIHGTTLYATTKVLPGGPEEPPAGELVAYNLAVD